MKKIFRTFILIGVLCLCRCAARSFKSRGRGFSILHAANIFQHGNDFERAIEHDSVRISGHHVLDPDLSCNNNNENPHEMKKHEEATNETQLAALMKLGWDEEECRSALEKSEGDVTKAVEILEDKDEYKDQLDETASNISITYGWNIEAARIALDECQLNVEDALQRLNEEEENIKSSFEVNVSDMVSCSVWNFFCKMPNDMVIWYRCKVAGMSLLLGKPCSPNGTWINEKHGE
jgi:NACalpha-BTF3-like transcription factor